MVVQRILLQTLNWYSNALRSRPFTTQITSSAALWAMGDILAQKIEQQPQLDTKRLAMTSSYGGLFNGTIGHMWYLYLDKIAQRYFTQGTRSFIAAKVIADSAIFGPIHVCAFFTLLTLAENGTLKDVEKKIKADAIPTLVAELSVWPAVQAVNFTKVPVKYQLLVVNAFTIADATFMSFIQHNNFFDKILKRT